MDEQTENKDFKEFERLFDDFNKALTDNDLNRASAALNSIWVLFHLMITPTTNPELKQLTFFKCPIDFTNGGKYLLQFLHISGPKITFDKNQEALIAINKQEIV